jgi:hypothetical protein
MKQLTGHLKREVQLGSVSVGLLTGLTVSDLKISESPDFSKGTFLSSDEFSIHVALWPLLMRKVVVRKLTLNKPEVTIVRYSDGKTFNFTSLTSSAPTASPQPGGVPVTSGATSVSSAPPAAGTSAASRLQEAPFLLLVTRAEIQKGVLRFVDQSPAAQSLEINPLSVAIKNVSLTEPFGVHSSMRLLSKGISADINLDGDADLRAGSFRFKKGSLKSGDSEATLAGEATGLKTDKPTADLTLDIKELNSAILKPFMQLPVGLTISGPLSGKATVKGDRSQLSANVSLDLSKPGITYAKQFAKPAKTPMSIGLRTDVNDLQSATLHDLSLVLASLKLNGRGSVQGLKTPTPSAQLHFETNRFAIEDVARLFPGVIPAGTSISGPLHLACDWSGTSLSSRIGLKLDGHELTVRKADQFAKPSGTPLDLAVIGDVMNVAGKKEQTITFQSLGGRVGPMQIQGNGTVRMRGAVSEAALNLKTNDFPLDQLAPLVPALQIYRPAGRAGANVRTSGPTSALQFNGTAFLQNVSARYENSDLTNLQGTVALTRETFSAPKLTGKLNGGDFSIKASGQGLSTRPDMSLEGTFAALDLDKLLPAISTAAPANPQAAFIFPLVAVAYAAAPAPADLPLKTSGRITVGKIKHDLYQAQNLDFSWALTELTQDLSRVSGMAEFKQAQGKVMNVEKLAAMSKAVRIALFPIVALQKIEKKGILKEAKLPSLQQIPFDSIRGDYGLKSGVMDIKTFELLGNDLSILTKGTVGLSGLQALGMNVTTKLARGAIGGTLGQIMQDESGRPTINFSLSGTVNEPRLRVQMEETGRKAVKQLGAELLKGLGLDKPRQTDGQAPAQVAPGESAPRQQKPAEDLEKALKNIFR